MPFGFGKPTDVILEVFIIKALFLNEDLTLSLEETEKPTLQNPTDAIIKVSAASICGSDIHFITGEVALYPNDRFIIGHEGVGVVEEVGSMVTNFKPGDRVVIPAGIACGDCIQCREGRIYACEMNTLFGHGRIKGNLPGLQSEYVRMPLADHNLVHIPDSVTDKEVLLVGDVLSTGYIGVINGKPQPGEDIAIFGAGPVGLCAVASAKLFSPSRIILVDLEDYRLEAGLKLGATHVINASTTDAAKEVRRITNGVGTQVSVDAAAFPETINNCLACTAKGGTVSVIGISPWKIEFNMARHDQVKVYFIGYNQEIIPQTDFSDPGQFFRGPDPPYRVMGTAEQKNFILGIAGFALQVIKINEIGRTCIDQPVLDQSTLVSFRGCVEGIVDRCLDNHAISRIGKGLDGQKKGTDHSR
jgi:alcohol dehydrogenase